MGRRAAIIGGGISGLAAARRISALGFNVTVLEAAKDLGGLGSTFPYGGGHIEKFYHCILPNDDALIPHIREMGLGDKLVWRETKMGFLYRRELYPLNTPMDLLRFAPLRLHERLRLGLVAIKARLSGENPELDNITAENWLRSIVGDRAFDILWKPLLAAKIGDGYPRIPALWLSSRMYREKSTKREAKGFLLGGYRLLIDTFERTLVESGAHIRLNAEVQAIDVMPDGVFVKLEGCDPERFDLVVSTLPPPALVRIARGVDIDEQVINPSLDYQGAICGVFLLDRPLSPYYWMPFVDCGATAQGVVEMSNLVPTERTHGAHVAYLINYAHRSSELFSRSEKELLSAYTQDLTQLFPKVEARVIDKFLFRAPFVEPLWTVGYLGRKPPNTVIPGRLYTACTAQLYPRVNSWNSCCDVVDDMIVELKEHTGKQNTP